MANPNCVKRNASKNPWVCEVHMVRQAVAAQKATELMAEGKKVKFTSTFLRKEKVRVWSVWTVPQK